MSEDKSCTPGSILVIDDNPDNLRLLTKILTEGGYHVRAAPNGAHALATVAKQAPDLILLDIVMPQMDGYEVCRRLKADAATCDIPVIFLSALHDTGDKLKGFDIGGVDYITKPFQAEEVLARVHTHAQLRALQGRLQAEVTRFRVLVEAACEGIVLHDDGVILDVNEAAAALFDCGAQALIGRRLQDCAPAESLPLLLGDSEALGEGEIFGVGGERRAVQIRSKRMPGPERDVQVTALTDLSAQRAVEHANAQLRQENRALKLGQQERYRCGDLIGRSAPMQQVYELVAKAAACDYNVVIYGESGTGKELVAQTIHARSQRRRCALVAVNSGAVTPSLFEREFFGHRKGAFTGADVDAPGYFAAAHGGTLFLDEIADLPLDLQVKLLRVLEGGEYLPVGAAAPKRTDARIIAAAHQNLAALARQGAFREDLFYRLHVIEIHLPPLRQRREDIPLLIEHFLAKSAPPGRVPKLPVKITETLLHHEWPGNIRELQNAIQRYLATEHLSLLSEPPPTSDDPGEAPGLMAEVEALERRRIYHTLQQTQWRRGQAAELLQLPRRTLQRKMQRYGFRDAADDSGDEL